MSGIRNNKTIAKKYTEAEIYFHQDLDGVTSFLAMKNYLESYNINVVESHVIQYGALEFTVKPTQPNRLACIVDFAHVKDIHVIATDHHDRQSGVGNTTSTKFKKARCNVEIISNEISNANVFTYTDIELIRTVDSADFVKYNITPNDIHKALFKYNKNDRSDKNRFLLGLVVNRLLLSLKNKRIEVKSLNKKTKHINKNLLECLALDSEPSLYSMYVNLKHYMKHAVSFEWSMDYKTYHTNCKLPTIKQLKFNLDEYIQTRKLFINDKHHRYIEYDEKYKIVRQINLGDVYKTGSYDRYVVFKNFPDSKFVCTIHDNGLIQVAYNPFVKNEYDIHLGDISDELYLKYKDVLSKFRISIEYIKKINESESRKLQKKYSEYTPIGFKYNDLLSFYKNDIYYLPYRDSGDYKTVSKLNLEEDNKITSLVKNTMNKLYSEWTKEEKEQMSYIKITGYDILKTMSGGHPYITNMQGFNYLSERGDALLKYFGKSTIYVRNINRSIM